MKTLGIITEYNPFHNGHKYHLEKSKEISNSDAIICVMSGHFLQRGTPAIMDKWTRTRNAIENGVDLVIELPTVYSMNSAEFFAKGSVEILNSLNIVNTLSFGSENGNIEPFLKTGKIFSDEPKEFKSLLKKHLSDGIVFPKARELALKEYLEENSVINSKPNNILGIEYSKAIFSTSSNIELKTITRTSNDYHDNTLTGNISSATAIRNTIKSNMNFNDIKNSIPKSTYDSFVKNKDDLVFRDDFEDLIFYKIRSMNLTELKNILFKILLDIKKDNIYHSPRYIRVLGFNKKGQNLIKQINEKSDIPVITNLKNYIPQDEISKMMIDTDIRATNIYQIIKNKKTGNLDYLNKPVIIK